MRIANILASRRGSHTQWFRWTISLLAILGMFLGTFATPIAPVNAAPYCEVDYTTNSWNSGFTANVKINNLSGVPIDGWEITWSFAAGEVIGNAWNANVIQTGANVSATNVAHNGLIGASGSVAFGFQATHGGTVGALENIKVNGVACGNGSDTEAPTAPTGLASPAQTATGIDLTWTASTDNVAVTGYDIYRGTTLVGSSVDTSYSDSGLTPDTAYSYTVRAKDAAGNVSDPSAALAVSTGISSDTEAPTVPSGLASPSQTSSSVNLTWEASTDNVAVTGYDIYRDTVLVDSSVDTSYSDSALTANTAYQYQVRAKDAAGNASALSAALTATTKEVAAGGCLVTYDEPVIGDSNFNIQNVRIANLGDTAINGWTLTFRFTKGELITSYWNATITQSGANVSASDVSHNAIIPAQGAVTFGFNGSHTDGVGTLEAFELNGMGCGDVEAPSAPTNLSSPSQTARAIDLSWDASTDNAGVTGYIIYRDGVEVGSSATTSINDSGLTPETSYSYTVRAKDAAGNLSDPSAALNVATIAQQPGAVFRVNSEGRITKDGQVLPVHCGSWFGLEGRHEPSSDPINPSGAAMELYIGNTNWANGGAGTGRTIQQTMDEIVALGINVVRLPIAPQTLDADDPQGMAPNLKNHESVLVPTARQALEEFIVLADQNNIDILLDIHSCSNYVGWRAGRLDARPPYADADRDMYDYPREKYSCAATNNPGSVETIHAYNETLWLEDLRIMAGLGDQLGVDNIIGIDIFNEPWDYTWAEWSRLAELAYDAINEINPNTLIFVEGISGTADNQDGTPDTITQVPHGDESSNPNWGENLFEAGDFPLSIPKERLVFSPHTYGPSVFVQKMFMDPAQPQCAGLEGDEAGDADCNIVINPAELRLGWEEHFGYLKDQNYAIVIGEFGGNLEWPAGATSLRDQARWSHITPGVDEEWQNAFVDYMVDRGIEGCYWSINPESGDTGGLYGHAYDPVSNTAAWGEWLDFVAAKIQLLVTLWGTN